MCTIRQWALDGLVTALVLALSAPACGANDDDDDTSGPPPSANDDDTANLPDDDDSANDDDTSPPPDDPCAGITPATGDALRAKRVVSGLQNPVHLAAPPGDFERLFVVEQPGRVRIVKDGTLLETPFLDIVSKVKDGGERGLLSVAFHPQYAENGRFFVNYTNNDGDTVIARYTVGGDPDVADPASALTVLGITQPYSNHNGGQLAFGPDGYLYLGMGDGGSANDPEDRAQNPESLLGKLLRLDINNDEQPYYRIPPDNPYAEAGFPRGLIWASGLRNPWRFSFDSATGDLWIADVGQNVWEEIDFAPAGHPGGLNYGWDVFEGNHCFEPPPLFQTCEEAPTEWIAPVHEYNHQQGCSITGGFVYRGCALPALHGRYFYSDYCTGFVRSIERNNTGTVTAPVDYTAALQPDAGSIDNPASFGLDGRGELYVLDLDGEVFRLVPAQ